MGKIARLPYAVNPLKGALIENRDAIKCISDHDATDTFFFVDPPYVGTTTTPYLGYTWADYSALLDALARVKGRFMLTSYENESLTAAIMANKWFSRTDEIKLNMLKSYININEKAKTRREYYVTNYPPASDLFTLC